MDLIGAKIRNLKELCMDIDTDKSVPVRINIPFYQRPYKWDEEHIDNLINDFQKNKQENEQGNDKERKQSEYFVGSVVLVKNAHGTDRSDVIDGQQRITTVFLMNYVRMLLIRAYIEELLCNRRTNLVDNYMRKYEECYGNLFGSKNVEKYSELREKIVGKLDEINDVEEEEKEELYTAIIKEFEKSMSLPEKNLSYIEHYQSEYEKKQYAYLEDDELALQYSRETFNEKLKKALSKVLVLVSQAENPQFFVVEEEEDPIVEHYITAIKEEYQKVFEYVYDEKLKPMEITKKMIELIDEMIENIKFCVIVTGNERDAYTLFEVLNDRAMDIEDIDLIKNLYYKEFCNKSGEEDTIALDNKIEKLDNIWGDEVFTKEFGVNKIKLTSYLGTIYLTANEDIFINKIERYREVLEKEYFDKHYYLPDKPYSYENILSDINLYRMIKEIIMVFDLPFRNATKMVIASECDVKKSITYKALQLVHALKYNGVMPALFNLIIKTYVVNFVPDGKNVSMADFKSYLNEIIEDAQHTNPDFKDIHKWSYEIWRAVLYSKDYAYPRELAKKIIANVNYDTYDLHAISVDTELAEKMKKQFKQWIDDWKYKATDLKARVLFINLFKYAKDEDKLKLQPASYTFTTDKLQLDHMEANNPSDVAMEKYFKPKDANEKREKYVNGIGNFMILDSEDNNEKNNKPLYDALGYYDKMCKGHWMIEEVREMLKDDKYSDKIHIHGDYYPVPNEEFFTERRARLHKYFSAMLSRKLDEKEVYFR